MPDPDTSTEPKDLLLPRITDFFFKRTRFTALLWLALVGFGIASYATLLNREGFPSIQIPVAVINGTYTSDDPAVIDQQVVKPINDIIAQQDKVSTVTSQSVGSFFSIAVQYEEDADGKQLTKKIQDTIASTGAVPEGARISYDVPYFGATGPETQQIDVAVSFYAKDGIASTEVIVDKAQRAVEVLNEQNVTGVREFSLKSPYSALQTPDGRQVPAQRSFDRFSFREDGKLVDANSVIIAAAANNDTDAITIDENVRQALDKLNSNPEFAGYDARVSASFAPAIKENISELQRVLLEGLIIVLIVGSLIIAIRASFITVLSMVTVIAMTLGLLLLLGYSLNVITLFALILSLSLIVDDTIIMVEAIDAARRKLKDRTQIVKQAARKVSRAMLAATLTASLSFAPFLFVGGVLGSFIRAIPITIISALLISLFVALVFIPFFSRYTLLTDKQLATNKHNELAAAVESKIARTISAPMRWARHSRKKLTGLGVTALIIGFGFIFAGGLIAQNVIFNIFPSTKDTNTIAVALEFPQGTTIPEAEAIAARADALTARTLKDNFEQASYYGAASNQTATSQIMLIPYTKRDIKSPELIKQLQQKFDQEFNEAKASVFQIDLGPPVAAFAIQINADENRDAALRAADAIATYIEGTTLTRISGEEARFVNVSRPDRDVFLRADGREIVQVNAGFNGTDTTTLVTLAETAVKEEFTDQRLAEYGLEQSDIGFNIGQEAENQDSFQALAIAFPLLLVVMYLVLAFQFRSILQPILIFMAIPFSIFGVMGGLYLTDNPISFFAMLGFFALIGLSVKNTILLTDFANQARRAGANPVDAAVEALHERFRPLIATSLTAVVSLIPLAITSPFWEGLAVVLIFGLLSSTMLVLTVFPYY